MFYWSHDIWAQHFHTKLHCQNPILRGIEWGVQNGPPTKNGVLPVTDLFFGNLIWVQGSFINSWICMFILYLFLGVRNVSFSKKFLYVLNKWSLRSSIE